MFRIPLMWRPRHLRGCERVPRRRHVPECGALEGRSLLSTVHAHVTAEMHAALVHRIEVQRAAALHREALMHRASTGPVSTMHVTVMSTGATAATPVASSSAAAADPPAMSSVASTSDTTTEPPVTIGSGSNTTTITPLAPGQYGPDMPYKWPGYRPGGSILR